jgi:L-ascorbate metabolism protein UlaG (beta-lactamase superfamily)
MVLPDNTIWHLTQSSNVLKIGAKLLIFDYPLEDKECAPGQGLSEGVVDPAAIAEEEVIVFVSHGHGDHFHRDIFNWRKTIANITYILSYDIIEPPEDALVVGPGISYTVAGMTIKAYPSTDAGVAYSIFIQNRHIYFSGDNAFWNWDGDLGDAIYIRTALSPIPKQPPMDIAFQVCDPRLEYLGAGGIYIFATHFQPRLLVPLHSFGKYDFNPRAQKRLRQAGFENDFWCIGGRGERYQFRL